MDQSEGTEPEISDLLKRIVKIGAISFAHSREILGLIWSGPAAL